MIRVLYMPAFYCMDTPELCIAISTVTISYTTLLRCINNDASETSRAMAYSVLVISRNFLIILPVLA